jgi:hypothetical protein
MTDVDDCHVVQLTVVGSGDVHEILETFEVILIAQVRPPEVVEVRLA